MSFSDQLHVPVSTPTHLAVRVPSDARIGRGATEISRHFLLLTVGTAGLALCACTSTPLTSTWTAPEVRSLNPTGKTIAVVFISRDERTRRVGETALAKDLSVRNARGVAVYTLLPDEGREDGELAHAELKRAGVDGVVVMRVVGNGHGIRLYGSAYALPASYSGFARYWDYGWGTLHESRDLQADTALSVETLVYSLDQGGKLVWASTSRSIDPRDLDRLIGDVATATAREMFWPRPNLQGAGSGPSNTWSWTWNGVSY